MTPYEWFTALVVIDYVAYLTARALGEGTSWPRALLVGAGYYMLARAIAERLKGNYLTRCQFCLKPKEEVLTLIVSRESRTSICDHCSQVCVDMTDEHLRRETADEPALRGAEPSQSADGVLPAAPGTPTPERPNRSETQSPPVSTSPGAS